MGAQAEGRRGPTLRLRFINMGFADFGCWEGCWRMVGGLYWMVYLFSGLLMVRFLLPGQRPLNRVWLGLSLGMVLMMWLPALMAFLVAFTWQAHALALLPLFALTLGCFFLRDRRPVASWDARETDLLRQMALVVVPLTLLSGYLQYTHNFRVAQDGSLWVGQSTYGDLSMHTSFITSLVHMDFPPEYALFPGQRLSYPFLTDSLSSSFYLMGWSLQASMDIPGTFMMLLCYMGVMCMAREMTGGKKTVVLAALLFFLNGGLGFLYHFDLAGGTEVDGTLTVWQRVQDILEGYYQTPTNQPTPYNLRWSNVIADLMLPQRTLLGGWCASLPCFYLLYSAFSPQTREKKRLRLVALLGVWAGALPLIHTHSFTALALCSLGMLIYDLVHDRERWKQLGWYALYGALAAAVALPQLFTFTFGQVFQQTAEQVAGDADQQPFIELWFNWVNNPNGTGELLDGYFWFYIKNIGLPFIALILALFEKNPRWRRLFAGALPIIIAVESIRFTPNIYDNNKLMYLAWLLCCMIVADWLAVVWRRLKGLRGRYVLAGLTAVVFFLSAGLTLWREAVSGYQAYSAGAVETGDFVREQTPEHATFLTGDQHLNPVASLAGRKIVCGADLWLYYHGLNTTERHADVARFYRDPANNLDVLDKYDVDYVMVSSYERANSRYQPLDIDALNELFPVVFRNGEATIWQVKGEKNGEDAALLPGA